MENEAIHLCAGTALRVWQLLRALWEPRLDQMVPLARSLEELHIRPARLEELAPCRLDAAQVGDTVGSCLERVCRDVRRASRKAGPLRDVPLSDPSFLCAVPLVMGHGPIDLLTASAEQRPHRRSITYHVCAGALPADMFVCLGRGVYLETPLYALARAASNYSSEELLFQTLEMLGAYQTGLFGPVESTRCLPLFDKNEFRAFVRASSGRRIRGINAVKPLLAIVVECAGSPMEAASVVLLCLPVSRGGYGLPWPVMNWRIDVPGALRGLSSWGWVACDAFWPDARVAFEYDGSVHCGGRSQRDVLRGNVLSLLEIPSVTITKGEFYDAGAFDRAARQLARLMRRRLDPRRLGPAWEAARDVLRGRVVGVLSAGQRAGELARAELARLAPADAAGAFGEADLWVEV